MSHQGQIMTLTVKTNHRGRKNDYAYFFSKIVISPQGQNMGFFHPLSYLKPRRYNHCHFIPGFSSRGAAEGENQGMKWKWLYQGFKVPECGEKLTPYFCPCGEYYFLSRGAKNIELVSFDPFLRPPPPRYSCFLFYTHCFSPSYWVWAYWGSQNLWHGRLAHHPTCSKARIDLINSLKDS